MKKKIGKGLLHIDGALLMFKNYREKYAAISIKI
jgi:hypothetical protein